MDLIRSDGGAALYAAAGGRISYVVATAPATSPPTLSPTQAWAFDGGFVVSPRPLAGTCASLVALLGLAGAAGAGARAIAWVDEAHATPLTAAVPILVQGATGGQVGPQPATLAFGNVALALSTSCTVTVGDADVTLSAGGVTLARTGIGGLGPLAPDGDATIALDDGPGAGAIAFDAAWDAYDLYVFFADDPLNPAIAPRGGDVRFFRPAPSGGGHDQLVYPTLPALDGTTPVPLTLDVELDPGAPFDGERTRMLLRAGTVPAALTGSYATTTGGATVTLTPQDGAGFALGRRPDALTGATSAYLAPTGPFALGTDGGAARVMCGLSGLEYLAVGDGDLLCFHPSRPALATPGPQGGGLLDATFTTSWVDVQPGGEDTAGAAEGDAGEPVYFGQPTASAGFAPGVIPGPDGGAATMTFPAAVAARIRALPAAAPFPLALYGGAPTVAGQADPGGLLAFEQAILAPVRASVLHAAPPARPPALAAGAGAAAPADPVPADPVFADATGAPLAGGRATTPQGFVITLNGAVQEDADGTPVSPAVATTPGTWASVELALSDADTLAFTPTAPATAVDPWLATTLLGDQLFLVLNDWARFPMVQRALRVAGFDFEVAPDPQDPDPTTIMVFKYNTSRSLADLIDDAGAWAHADVFVGDDAAVAAAQRQLQAALATAAQPAPSDDDPFLAFRTQIAPVASWTGMLSFNGLIDGNGMPPDLQMLFAGIDGALRAHHFGVEVNRVERPSGQPPKMVESSLFGVIHYKPDGPPPGPPSGQDYAFSVTELNVALRNSTVTEFHATVAVTMNQLFGRPVTMTPATTPPNTLTLVGQYQRHGDVGTVTFSVDGAAAFSFAGPPATSRVLDTLTVTAATLVPLTTAPQGNAAEISARVTLDGRLAFAADPFPGVAGVDLFSYGRGDAGLGVSGVALALSCALDAEGQRSGPTTIVPDLSAVALADPGDATRAGSLAALLPLTLSSFLQDADGLTAAKLGALPVHVLELDAPAAGGGPWSTSKPQFALRFRLPLGSLGSLSDAHASIDAALVLGWGPSATTPDDDAAALLVQLPALSAGAFGFNLEGLLKTTFGDANLLRVTPAGGDPVYVLMFNNVALSLMGLKLPPRVITDFIVFAGGDGASSLGWSLAATLPAQSGGGS